MQSLVEGERSGDTRLVVSDHAGKLIRAQALWHEYVASTQAMEVWVSHRTDRPLVTAHGEAWPGRSITGRSALVPFHFGG